jgi:ring-1,2-phenylacetyl-CoA epoxidase subunit PaaC
MVKALSELFGYTNELFEPDALELRLIEQGVAVDTSALKTQWLDIISSILDEATLAVPENDWAVRGGREGYHTEHLGHLLTVMQSVHRAYPGCEW